MYQYYVMLQVRISYAPDFYEKLLSKTDELHRLLLADERSQGCKTVTHDGSEGVSG